MRINKFSSIIFYTFILAILALTPSRQIAQNQQNNSENICDFEFKDVILKVQEKHGNIKKFIELDATMKIKKDAKATILVCHGYMCNKNHSNILRLIFKDYNVMTFNFRAHGPNSSEQTCTFGIDEVLDIQEAVKYIQTHPDIKHIPIICYGFSMGAVSAIRTQSQEPIFKAMILDCPFECSDKVISRGIDKIKFSIAGYEFNLPAKEWLKSFAYSKTGQYVLQYALKYGAGMDSTKINTQFSPIHPIEDIKKITTPIFFITCHKDEKVPVTSVIDLFKAASSEFKYLWITKGSGHCNSLFTIPECYSQKIINFIESIISGSINHAFPKTSITYDNPEWKII